LQPAPRRTLVLGGARSGKSRFAEAMITRTPPPWTYIATAQAFDDEMRRRIGEHKSRRQEGWVTIEAPLDLADTITTLSTHHPVLIDCLTLWLNNILLAGRRVDDEIARLVSTLNAWSGPLVCVSNEVGLGIVPDNALARSFRDHAGILHQRLAESAELVVLMVAGLPLNIKSITSTP
jgi:adenosylcobinamide kinase / adenosylcobinamide-phosphate guanylyltransferase